MMLRVLAVCEGGNCRSVSMALVLKATKRFDALACSWKDINPETLEMLCDWADAIIVMETYMRAKIPERYLAKTNICDVGPDRWFNPFDEELREIIIKYLTENRHKLANRMHPKNGTP